MGRNGIDRDARHAAVQTAEITVIFTTTEATLAALRVAVTLGRACGASVRLIAQQPRAVSRDANVASARSAVESEAFQMRVATEMDARVRVLVCVCSRLTDLTRTLLRRHSLVVLGGRRSWWPTKLERLRRALEAQGHFVLLVDA